MIAEKVPHVIQQARNIKKWCTPFESTAAGFTLSSGMQGPSVGAYGSFNPVPGMRHVDKSCQWRDFLSSNDLFVFTPATLVNLLVTTNPQLLEIDYFIIDEAHHTVKDHPFKILMTRIGRSGPEAKRPRILGVTATISGRLDLDRSEEHLKDLAKNLESEVFSEHGLSAMAHDELSGVVAKIKPTELVIETSELESWFETTVNGLASDLRNKIENLNKSSNLHLTKGSDGKRSAAQMQVDKEIKGISVFAKQLDEANKIANDCGVGRAMIWLSGEYLSSMCENHTHQGTQEWLAWVEFRFMLSGIFSDLSNTFLDVKEGYIDEKGIKSVIDS
jgi:hypothetical protein